MACSASSSPASIVVADAAAVGRDLIQQLLYLISAIASKRLELQRLG